MNKESPTRSAGTESKVCAKCSRRLPLAIRSRFNRRLRRQLQRPVFRTLLSERCLLCFYKTAREEERFVKAVESLSIVRLLSLDGSLPRAWGSTLSSRRYAGHTHEGAISGSAVWAVALCHAAHSRNAQTADSSACRVHHGPMQNLRPNSDVSAFNARQRYFLARACSTFSSAFNVCDISWSALLEDVSSWVGPSG